VQTYQTFQYVVPRDGIFLCKWRSSFAGSSGGKMNVQSASALNTRYKRDHSEILEVGERIILKYIPKQYIFTLWIGSPLSGLVLLPDFFVYSDHPLGSGKG
jgi:hypothetical protein